MLGVFFLMAHRRLGRTTLIALLKQGHRANLSFFLHVHRYEIMLDCWKEDPELRPSFSFLKRKTEEIIQQANQAYPYLDFNLNDYLPYCNLRLTSEAVSTENILEEYKQSNDNEKESSGSEVETATKDEKERESSPTGV